MLMTLLRLFVACFLVFLVLHSFGLSLSLPFSSPIPSSAFYLSLLPSHLSSSDPSVFSPPLCSFLLLSPLFVSLYSFFSSLSFSPLLLVLCLFCFFRLLFLLLVFSLFLLSCPVASSFVVSVLSLYLSLCLVLVFLICSVPVLLLSLCRGLCPVPVFFHMVSVSVLVSVSRSPVSVLFLPCSVRFLSLSLALSPYVPCSVPWSFLVPLSLVPGPPICPCPAWPT